MNLADISILLAVGLFAGMLGLQELGRQLGARRLKVDPEGARTGLGAVEGAVFGLMGLIVAFSFHGAASRFDVRRQLIVEEANAIGTAYLRLDVLPAEAQPKLRDLMRRYVDSRLEVYRALPDIPSARAALARSNALQAEIWSGAVSAVREAPQTGMLVLPALNAMIDLTTTRTVALQTHPPAAIYAMLGLIAFACALLAGYGMAGARTHSWIHEVGFAAILTLTVYVILDLEHPRAGLIRVDSYDQVLHDARATMR